MKYEENYGLYWYFEMPVIHLEYKIKETVFDKAYRSSNDNNNCEYCHDTTTWD